MRKTGKLLAVLGLVGALGACAVAEGRQSAGNYVDDATISTKVRTEIVKDPNLKLSQIDVHTMQGTVQLSGFVDNAQAKAQAGDVARKIDGVKSVKNDIVVQTAQQRR